MARTLPLGILDHVRIASPCPMRWEHMRPVDGGQRTRHCERCQLNVHNLSDMTRPEAETFLAARVPGQRICGVFYQRPDGTILTRDCPVGLRAARQRLVRLSSRIAAAIILLITGAVLARPRDRDVWRPGLAQTRPFLNLMAWARGRAAPAPIFPQIAGDLCIPAPPPVPLPAPPPAPPAPPAP